MGPVVDVLAGDEVAERRGPAAEDATALEEHDLIPALLQGDGRGQAREASTDHDHLHLQ
jgi:hypothetical protein